MRGRGGFVGVLGLRGVLEGCCRRPGVLGELFVEIVVFWGVLSSVFVNFGVFI